jgi:hypothetical protein
MDFITASGLLPAEIAVYVQRGPNGIVAEVPGYVQIMDNDRVRGWRLVLEPGQSASTIRQTAPGIRIVVDGGELVESVPGYAVQARDARRRTHNVRIRCSRARYFKMSGCHFPPIFCTTS